MDACHRQVIITFPFSRPFPGTCRRRLNQLATNREGVNEMEIVFFLLTAAVMLAVAGTAATIRHDGLGHVRSEMSRNDWASGKLPSVPYSHSPAQS
jgi:hypothetical protein